MKIYTIGRDPSCKISFNNEQVSRQHAILRVHNSGKMEIVDKSTNGTFINNVHIASNVPVPVRRQDVVSFAKTCQLDWSLVEDPLRKYKLLLAGILAAIVIIAGCIFLSHACDNSDEIVDEDNTPAKVSDKSKAPEKDKAKDDVSASDDKESSTSGSVKKDSTKKGTASWIREEIRKGTRSSSSNPKPADKSKSKESKSKEPQVKEKESSSKKQVIL